MRNFYSPLSNTEVFTAQKMFPFIISLVNVNKSTVVGGFVPILLNP